MCGIAGILNAGNTPDILAQAKSMADVQAHRGPNGLRVGTWPGAVLVHNRLSIIDLSDRATQPMASADGRHVLVFNGEIYNYKELRRELESDHAFTSDSDTEVLLAALRHWGEAALDRLNGMFAFCFYDTVNGSAFFARDRFGQKPLYFTWQGDAFYFASEVKALLRTGIAARPNLAVWSRYLVTGSYDDDSDSYFDGISQLQPGECARFTPDRGLTRRRWYDLADHMAPWPGTDAGEAAEYLRQLLSESGRLHMRSDVPVGVSLSGGLDSSALLSSLSMAGKLSSRTRCFSVDFGDSFSEKPWIDAAARCHGLEAEITLFSPQDFLDSLRPLTWHLEGPIGGLMNCALQAVMRSAKAAGIPVLLDGTGLDEAFAGYRNHHNLYLGLLLTANDAKADQAVAEYARNWGVSEQAARTAGLTELQRSGTTIDGTVPTRPEILAADLRALSAEAEAAPSRTGDRLHDDLLHYVQVRKIPRNCRFKDRLSMAYGLELRLPFLDHRIMEFGLSLPPEFYFLHGRSKSIVREAVAGVLDDEVRLAAKRSIQAPQGPWLRGEPMVSYLGDLISSRSFIERGWYDMDQVRTTFDQFRAGKFDNSFFVWQWINVEEWHNIFV